MTIVRFDGCTVVGLHGMTTVRYDGCTVVRLQGMTSGSVGL